MAAGFTFSYLATSAGDMSFEGFLVLPPECLQNPGELVFPVRQSDSGGQPGTVLLYGAERTLQ